MRLLICVFVDIKTDTVCTFFRERIVSFQVFSIYLFFSFFINSSWADNLSEYILSMHNPSQNLSQRTHEERILKIHFLNWSRYCIFKDFIFLYKG